MEGGNANSHRWFDENIEAMATDTQHRFSLRETRAIVQDLFEPKPAIYWFDFLASMLVGGVCFTAARQINLLPVRCLLGLAACLAYYRAALFTHELVHLRTNSMRAFRVAWNLFCGIPFLMPSFLYYTHRDHHVRKHYGTPNDGEYLPFTTSPRIELLKYFLQPLFFPLLFVMRFLVLTPLTWFSPRLRRWVQRKFSSMVIDPDYVRPSPTRAELKVWRLQEAGCFLYSLTAAWLFIRGRLPITLLAHAYLTAVVILMVNYLRAIASHRFLYGREPVSFTEQLLDSVNHPYHPWTGELWAPLGLRFHALHHLFPSMPYHNLAKAHRRLVERLPADSPYRQTESPSLWATLRQLWRATGGNQVRFATDLAIAISGPSRPHTET